MNTHDFQQLISFLKDGDHINSVEETKKLQDRGYRSEEIIVNGIHPAMELLDSKCTSEQFNLLELMLAGRAVSSVIKLLFTDLESSLSTKQKVVVAALEGDIHDLGKSIVKIVLIGKGYQVIDCGKDVPVEKIIETIEKETAKAVCISGLITSIIPQVKDVKTGLIEKGFSDVLVLAGGAALKQASKEELNVDFVGQTAFEAAHFLQEKLG
ncbi:MAG: cobalamin-dependent protein [Campylobacterota bacterium]|nr:cobalamin-dependent protein [Campylobacterota bacterium]